MGTSIFSKLHWPLPWAGPLPRGSNCWVPLESWVEFPSCSLILLVNNYKVITSGRQGKKARRGENVAHPGSHSMDHSVGLACQAARCGSSVWWKKRAQQAWRKAFPFSAASQGARLSRVSPKVPTAVPDRTGEVEKEKMHWGCGWFCLMEEEGRQPMGFQL